MTVCTYVHTCMGKGGKEGNALPARRRQGMMIVIYMNPSRPISIYMEEVPNEEHDIHEGPELDRPAVAGALRVFAGLDAEVEANGDQVGDVVGSGGGGGICLSNNEVHNSQGGGLFSLDGGILLRFRVRRLLRLVCP